jgi:hypothetical protein
VGGAPGYVDNPLRHDLWRAGHAPGPLVGHAPLRGRGGPLAGLEVGGRLGAPIAAILIPAAFFLSTLSPTATSAGPLVNLAYPGAAALALGVLALGVGLIRVKEDR